MQRTDSSSIARILASAWQQQRNARTGQLFWGALAFWVLMPFGLYAWMEVHIVVPPTVYAYPAAARQLLAAEHHNALVTFTTLVGFYFAIGWFGLVNNLLAQNHPTLARLVPGHVARLRSALLVAWALAILAAAALPGTLLDAPLQWAFGAAAVLPLVAMARRWPVMWLAVVPAPVWLAKWFAGSGSAGSLGALSTIWPRSDWLVMAIVLTAGALALVAVVREEGNGQRIMYEAGRAFGRRFATSPRAGRPSLTSNPYAWWMARLLARRDGSVMSRLLLGLGPKVHWTVRIRDGALFGAVCGGLFAVILGVVVFFFDRVVRDIFPWLAFGLLTGACTPALQAAAQLYGTRREQALLVLLPGVPRGAGLNRWLGWRMSVLFVGSALWGFALTGVLVAFCEAIAPGLLERSDGGMGAAVAAALLPQVAWQWRSWARLRGASRKEFLPSLTPALLGSAALGLHAWARFGYLAMGLAFAAVAFAWCAWRWHRMGGEPTAFPVGRLG